MHKKFIISCVVLLVFFNLFLAFKESPHDVYCVDETGHDCFDPEYYVTCGEYPFEGYPYASNGFCTEDWKAAQCCVDKNEWDCLPAITCPYSPDK